MFESAVFGAIAVLDVDIGWEIRMKHLFLNLPTELSMHLLLLAGFLLASGVDERDWNM